jgi:hypothetical protein
MLFISVHMINIAKQSQLLHNITVYLFMFFVYLLHDMFMLILIVNITVHIVHLLVV